METEEVKGTLKGSEWKSIGKSVADEQSLESAVKKRLPKKVRHIPDCYFLPRKSIPSAIAFYGSWILGGIGAGMLAEIWINKKVKGIYIVYSWICSYDHMFSVCLLQCLNELLVSYCLIEYVNGTISSDLVCQCSYVM